MDAVLLAQTDLPAEVTSASGLSRAADLLLRLSGPDEDVGTPPEPDPWLEPKPRPRRSPWPVTFTTHAAVAGGSRSLHGSFGVTAGSQHLYGGHRANGVHRFVSVGGSFFLRWYAPHAQVGCGEDVSPPRRSNCPITFSLGPTIRWGIALDDRPRFSIPHRRFDIGFTPFITREPLRDPAGWQTVVGGRVTLSATYGGFSEDILDDEEAWAGSGMPLSFIAFLPAALVNHLELYGEGLFLDGRPLLSVGVGVGFGL